MTTRMRFVNRTAHAALVAAAGLAVFAPAQALAQDTELGEVVVTAQKRSENLNDVPVSVTAISAENEELARIIAAFEHEYDEKGVTPGFVTAPEDDFSVPSVDEIGRAGGDEDAVGEGMGAALRVILGDDTLEGVAGEWARARAAERDAMARLTGAIIAAAVQGQPETTIAQRIVRAKKSLGGAGIAYEERDVAQHQEEAAALGLTQAPTLVVHSDPPVLYAGVARIREFLKNTAQ